MEMEYTAKSMRKIVLPSTCPFYSRLFHSLLLPSWWEIEEFTKAMLVIIVVVISVYEDWVFTYLRH